MPLRSVHECILMKIRTVPTCFDSFSVKIFYNLISARWRRNFIACHDRSWIHWSLTVSRFRAVREEQPLSRQPKDQIKHSKPPPSHSHLYSRRLQKKKRTDLLTLVPCSTLFSRANHTPQKTQLMNEENWGFWPIPDGGLAARGRLCGCFLKRLLVSLFFLSPFHSPVGGSTAFWCTALGGFETGDWDKDFLWPAENEARMSCGWEGICGILVSTHLIRYNSRVSSVCSNRLVSLQGL